MARGRVRWFNNHFGYGFITHENGEDVFVHHTVIDPEVVSKDLPAHYRPPTQVKTLKENEMVNYTYTSVRGRLKALKVTRGVSKKHS